MKNTAKNKKVKHQFILTENLRKPARGDSAAYGSAKILGGDIESHGPKSIRIRPFIFLLPSKRLKDIEPPNYNLPSYVIIASNRSIVYTLNESDWPSTPYLAKYITITIQFEANAVDPIIKSYPGNETNVEVAKPIDRDVLGEDEFIIADILIEGYKLSIDADHVFYQRRETITTGALNHLIVDGDVLSYRIHGNDDGSVLGINIGKYDTRYAGVKNVEYINLMYDAASWCGEATCGASEVRYPEGAEGTQCYQNNDTNSGPHREGTLNYHRAIKELFTHRDNNGTKEWVMLQSTTGPCSALCEINCQTVCQAACQSGCEVSCQSCDSCQSTCETTCQTSAELCGTCDAACQSCDTCDTTCDTTCQSTCESTCQTASENPCGACETACQSCDTCDASCETACDTACQTTCETGSPLTSVNIVASTPPAGACHPTEYTANHNGNESPFTYSWTANHATLDHYNTKVVHIQNTNGYSYTLTCQVTDACGHSKTDSVTVDWAPNVDSVSLSSSVSTVCHNNPGSNIDITWTATVTPSDASSLFTYDWYIKEGGSWVRKLYGKNKTSYTYTTTCPECDESKTVEVKLIVSGCNSLSTTDSVTLTETCSGCGTCDTCDVHSETPPA